MPKVSVILTSFNHEKYIQAAIDSVIAQTFTDFELIVWDDASTDGSWEIIERCTDPRIKAFRNDRNRRPIFGVRKAISEVASGDYIAMHHSDDMWMPTKLEKQVTALDGSPELGAVFTWVQIVDQHGNKSPHDWFDQEDKTRWEWLNELFLGENHLSHPSVLIRRKCYLDVGLYRYGFAQAGDAEMWSRILLKHSIHVLQEKLTLHRHFADRSHTSGDRLEAVIRTSNEWGVLRENYLSLSRQEDILAIFPNLGRFRTADGFDSKFLLAMACLYECRQRNAWQQGLRWLFELLDDPEGRDRMARLYSFSYADFIRLTGEFDVYFVEADKRLAERDQTIAERDARIRQIHASRSWRLTRPVRFLERLARAARNR